MSVIEQWGVPLAVVGMLLATLFMVSLVGRYQVHRALVGTNVRRLESGVDALSAALQVLRGVVPLSRELRLTVRGDILARLHQIRRLYRRYPDIAARIQTAEAAFNSESAAGRAGVGPLENEQVFRRVVAALDTLSAVMVPGGTLRPVPSDVRAIFRRELGERRAEVMARFHLVQSHRYANNGNMPKARSHLIHLLHVLRQRGPGTAFVRELYAEAESALNGLGNHQRVVAGVDEADLAGPATATARQFG